MNNDIQELKNELRTSFKSFMNLIGGDGIDDLDAEKYAMLNFLVSGVYAPYQTSICSNGSNSDCLDALQKCINGTNDGENSYADCKRFVNSSTFLRKLNNALKKEFFDKDNDDFKYVKGKNGEKNTQIQSIKGILDSIGLSLELKDSSSGKTNLVNSDGEIPGDKTELFTYVDDIVKEYFDKDEVKKFATSDHMRQVVKSLVRAMLMLKNDLSEADYKVMIKNYDYKTVRVNSPDEPTVKIFDNRMNNSDVLEYAVNRSSSLIKNINSLEVLFHTFIGGIPMYGGSTNLLSSNNIYKSINFIQSGGNSANVETARKILTNYVNTGLITEFAEQVIEDAENANSKYHKKFDSSDISNIRASLKIWKNQEVEMLKVISYMNTLLNRKEDIVQSGGAPGGSTIEHILKNLSNKAKDKAQSFSEMLNGIKNMTQGIKKTLERYDESQNYMYIFKDVLVQNFSIKLTEDGSNYRVDTTGDSVNNMKTLIEALLQWANKVNSSHKQFWRINYIDDILIKKITVDNKPIPTSSDKNDIEIILEKINNNTINGFINDDSTINKTSNDNYTYEELIDSVIEMIQKYA